MTDDHATGQLDVSDAGALAVELSRLALSLEQQGDLQETLDAIVHAAVGTIAGTQYASISSIQGRKEVITRASTGELPRMVDRAQYETGEGPCLDTLYERRTADLPDLRHEDRWPHFARRASELGVGSMLAVQLFVEGDDLGALNLSSRDREAFGEESEHVALLFASHAAVAMVGAQKQEQLRSALGSRDIIGQAMGILMERHKITQERAFDVLARASQNTNRKLSDIAAELASSGRLPGAERAGAARVTTGR